MRDFDSIKQKEMGSIENRVRHIYNRGYEDGYKDGRENIIDTYDAGLDDAWECARKICTNWCISDACLAEIFGKGHTIDDIMRLNSASEAIAKIKEWEEKKKQEEAAKATIPT